MKNFWLKKQYNNFFGKLTTLVLSVLIFNLSYPALVLATDTDGEPVNTATTSTEKINNTETASTSEAEAPLGISTTTASSTNDTLEDSSATSTSKTKDAEIVTENASSSTLEAGNENNATTSENSASSSASTTSATSTEGVDGTIGATTTLGIIKTGDATTFNTLTNLINNLSINSSLLIGANNFSANSNTVDLRSSFFQVFGDYNSANSTINCSDEYCGFNSIDNQINDLAKQVELSVKYIGEALVENRLALSSDTGHNKIDGDGFILCGDATTFSDVVNAVNNIAIDSEFLFQSIYKQGNLGFLVLPTTDYFQEKLTKNPYFSELLFSNENTANVENTTDVAATTGNNTLGQGGEIVSGNALAKMFIRNLLNRTLINSISFNIEIQAPSLKSETINILGGLPAGMSLVDTLSGVKLTYEPEESLYSKTGFSAEQISKLTADLKASTTIKNYLDLYANSGFNDISGNGLISCGNATAIGNVVNFANNIVIGSQLVDILINANNLEYLAFGQPDLQIGLGAKFSESDYIKNGSDITYLYTIFNGGDRIAEDVVVKNSFPNESLRFVTPDWASEKSLTQDSWFIGDILPGEIKELKVTANTDESFGRYLRRALPLQAEVYTKEVPADDFNLEDNKDSLSLFIGKDNIRPSLTKTPANLKLSKTADKKIALGGEEVAYTLEIDNLGSKINDATLIDVMFDSNGNVISEQTWPLETIGAGEIITINYAITVPKNTKDDIYTNYAQVVGYRSDNQGGSIMPFASDEVAHVLEVKNNLPEGEVLGATAPVVCEPYLKTYLKQDQKNDDYEVLRLQFFLKNFVDKDLIISSVFDKQTKLAVETFQQNYAEEILSPWGMEKSSGYVYYTTQKKINEIMCGNTTLFPLSSEQESEVEFFKNNKENIPEADWIFAKNDTSKSTVLAETTPEPKTSKKITFSEISPFNRKISLYRPLDLLLSLLLKDTKTTLRR